MSLHAVVFSSAKRLVGAVISGEWVIDADTGEVSFAGKDQCGIRFEAKAIACRLGNISSIEELRQTVFANFEMTELPIIARILRNGTHCGDKISHDELPSLKEEIKKVSSAVAGDAVTEFIRKLRDLIHSAEAEGNPIVFT